MPDVTSEPVAGEAEVRSLIEDLGGVEGFMQSHEAFHRVVLRMNSERASLLDQHPDKWVAVGAHGLLVAADSMEKLLEEVGALGLGNDEFTVEYLDSNPSDLIL